MDRGHIVQWQPAVTALVLICLLSGALASRATELAAGQLYPGGTRLEVTPYGVSFQVPEGWQGGWPEGTEVFLLESPGQSGRILLTLDEGSLAALEAYLARPITLDAVTQLTPEGAPRREGERVRADFDVSIDGVRAAVVGRAVTDQMLAAATALAPQDAIAGVKAVAEAVITSFAVLPATPVASAPVASGWDAYLRGRHLVRFYSGSGYTEEEHVYLCSDGSFYRTMNSGGFGPGASGAYGGRGQGRWQTSGAPPASGELLLIYGSGSVSRTSTPGFDTQTSGPGGERVSYSLAFDGDKLLLNDRRWLRDNNEVCQ